MSKYRAIVSIEFDDDDISEALGGDVGRSRNIDPQDFIYGELDNLSVGGGWVEQLFVDGEASIIRLSPGMTVEINPPSE